MKISGEFRDVLSRNGVVFEDRGWKSNRIVSEFGDFLAAVMKKDFIDSDQVKPVGIEYMAVGSSSGNDANVFRGRVEGFFDEWNEDGGFNSAKPKWTGDNWIWVKEIQRKNIDYLIKDDKPVPNTLRVSVEFGANQPDNKEPLRFQEFALLGILRRSDGTFDTDKMFFINHAEHGIIDKAASVTITRTVNLTFPVNQEGVA